MIPHFSKCVPKSFEGVVSGVIDGDTLEVITTLSGVFARSMIVRVRLANVDTPETKNRRGGTHLQANAGNAVKKVMTDALLNKRVQLFCEKGRFDSFGRIVADIVFVENFESSSFCGSEYYPTIEMPLSECMIKLRIARQFVGGKTRSGKDWDESELSQIEEFINSYYNSR